MISINTIATSVRAFNTAIASLPVVAVSTSMPRRSSTLREGKYVARIVIDQQHRAVHEVFIGAVQTLEHALLGRRQIGDHPMQEQRGLIEQALRRFHSLDHDAARHGVQLRILIGGQLAAGEHHHRHIAQCCIVANALEHFEAGHIGQLQVEHHAIDRVVAQLRQRLRAGIRGQISMSSWPSNSATPLRSASSSSTSSKRLRRAPRVVLDARKGVFQSLRGGRLLHERKRAARQTVMPVFIERHDLHGNVASRRILLELAQDRPSEHVGQEDVERNGRRMVLARECERIGAAIARPAP